MTHAARASQTAIHRPIVAVVGATGTGKSSFALDLAEALGNIGLPSDIVNADAMQLYKGMDIGTAKVPPSLRRGITHHLFDIWNVTTEASVAEYQSIARAVIRDIQSRGRVPILVGGSGLYVSSVLYEFEFPGTDPAVRAELELRAETEGTDSLMAELAQKDPLAAAAIDPQNVRRVVRALEVIHVTGKPFGAGLDAERRPWQTKTHILGLHREREDLVVALDARVVGMWEDGLVEEVESLIPGGLRQGVTASRAIGYQQVLEFLDGNCSRQDAIENTQALTRRYARRQVSWFRRDQNITWFSSGDEEALTCGLSLVREA